MPQARRWQEIRRRGDDGVTLVELLVVVVITGIVLPLAFAVLLSVQRQTKSTLQFSDDVGQARLAMQSIDRQVRSADAPLTVTPSPSGPVLGLLTTAEPAHLGNPWCVQFTVSGGKLLTRSFSPTGPPPTTWPSGSLARGLTATAPFTLDPASPAQVRVRFDVIDAGRSTRIESQLTARNLAGSGGTAMCALL